MSRRAFALATLFASFSGAGVAAAQVRGGGAVALDFTPLGTAAVSTSGRSAAPADVNFGTYPLSVLGIENAIRNADANVGAYASGAARIDDGPIAYAVVAIRDWERHYPSDPWIAKDLLALARFYAHVGTAQAHACAENAVAWMAHDYPHTPYAEVAVRSLAPAAPRPVERAPVAVAPVAVAPAPVATPLPRPVVYVRPAPPPPDARVEPDAAEPTLPPYAVPEPGGH